MFEPKTELTYKCFTEQIRENYQRIGAVYNKNTDKKRGEPKMLEEKIEKSLLGKVRATARKYAGVYLLAAGLAVGGMYGCGDEQESCVGTCPTCSGSKYCSCSKPKGAPDDECGCSCVGSSCETADYGICCQAGMCYEKSDFEMIDGEE